MTTTTQTQPTQPTQIINWFEIPVTDMPRARALYEAMLDTTLAAQRLRRGPARGDVQQGPLAA